MSNAWQMVTCSECGKHYRCTPNQDYHNATDATDGVCETCLYLAAGLHPDKTLMFVAPGATDGKGGAMTGLRETVSTAFSVNRDDYRLCFVDGCFAHFANVPPPEMSGDDWDDAPHDCNASVPYPRYGQEVVVVAFDGPYELHGCCEPYLSADQINRGEAPWLVDRGYGVTYPAWRSQIDAGTTLADFKAQIAASHGSVYERCADS